MNRHTLDLEHKTHLKKIQDSRTALESAEKHVEKMEQDMHSTDSFELLRKRYRLEAALSALSELQKNSDGLDYHLRTGNTLLKYYDIAEGTTLEGEGTKQVEPKNSILSYFESKERDTALINTDADAHTKAGLMESFMSIMNGEVEHKSVEAENIPCTACGSTDTITYVLESQRVCCDCNAVEYVVLDNERAGNSSMPKDGTVFHFKRQNHLIETLASCEGREHATIPNSVFGTILTELKKQKITNMVDVTKEQVKAILKKTQLSKYYEHCSYIVSQLSGKPTEPFPPALVQQFIKMFVQVQRPFIKHAPPIRKNFLSYKYVLYKFCELLEHDEYLDRFSLLKSGDKLSGQDMIWKKICYELQWQYIPTI
jgi:hypothetical protein